MDDKYFLYLAMVVIVCLTAGTMQNCHYDHQIEIECIRQGHAVYPNGKCNTLDKK